MYVFEINPEEVRKALYQLSELAEDLRTWKKEVEDVRHAIAGMTGMADVCSTLEMIEGCMLIEADDIVNFAEAGILIANTFDDTEEEIMENIERGKASISPGRSSMIRFSEQNRRADDQRYIDMNTMDELTRMIS